MDPVSYEDCLSQSTTDRSGVLDTTVVVPSCSAAATALHPPSHYPPPQPPRRASESQTLLTTGLKPMSDPSGNGQVDLRRFRRVSDNSLVVVAEEVAPQPPCGSVVNPLLRIPSGPTISNGSTTAVSSSSSPSGGSGRRLSAAAVPTPGQGSPPWALGWSRNAGDVMMVGGGGGGGTNDEDHALIWSSVVRSSDLITASSVMTAQAAPGRSPLSTIGGHTDFGSAPTSNRTLDKLIMTASTARRMSSGIEKNAAPISHSNLKHRRSIAPTTAAGNPVEQAADAAAFAQDFQTSLSYTPMRTALRIRTNSLQTAMLEPQMTPPSSSPLLLQKFLEQPSKVSSSTHGGNSPRRNTIFFATLPDTTTGSPNPQPLPLRGSGGQQQQQQGARASSVVSLGSVTSTSSGASAPPPPPPATISNASYVLLDTQRDLICGVLTGFHEFCLVEEKWLRAHHIYTWCCALLQVFSLIMLCVGTVAPIRRANELFLLCVEAIFAVWLLVDLVLRLITIRTSRLWFLLNIWMLVDVLSVFPFLIDVFSGFRTDLRALGTVRIVRIISVGTHLASTNSSSSNLKAFTIMIRRAFMQSGVVSLLPVLIGLAIFVSATAVWLAEQTMSSLWNPRLESAPNATVMQLGSEALWIRDDGTISPYQSIYHTMWFAMVTMFTIGYGGDLVPISPLAKALCSIVMIGGVVTLAFPTVILSAAFHDAYNTRFLMAVQEKLQTKQREAIEASRNSRRLRLMKERLRAVTTNRAKLRMLGGGGAGGGGAAAAGSGLLGALSALRGSNPIANPMSATEGNKASQGSGGLSSARSVTPPSASLGMSDSTSYLPPVRSPIEPLPEKDCAGGSSSLIQSPTTGPNPNHNSISNRAGQPSSVHNPLSATSQRSALLMPSASMGGGGNDSMMMMDRTTSSIGGGSAAAPCGAAAPPPPPGAAAAKLCSKFLPNETVKTKLLFCSFTADHPSHVFSPEVLPQYCAAPSTVVVSGGPNDNLVDLLRSDSPPTPPQDLRAAADSSSGAPRTERYWLRQLLRSGSMPPAIVSSKSLSNFKKQTVITQHDHVGTTPRHGGGGGKERRAAKRRELRSLQLLEQEDNFFSDETAESEEEESEGGGTSPNTAALMGESQTSPSMMRNYTAQRRGLRALDRLNHNILQLRSQLIRRKVVTFPPKLKLLCVGGTNVVRCVLDKCFPPGSLTLSLTLVLNDAVYHESQVALAKANFGSAVESVEMAPIHKLRVRLQLCRSALRRALWARNKASAVKQKEESEDAKITTRVSAFDSPGKTAHNNSTPPATTTTPTTRLPNQDALLETHNKSNGSFKRPPSAAPELSYVSTLTGDDDDDQDELNSDDDGNSSSKENHSVDSAAAAGSGGGSGPSRRDQSPRNNAPAAAVLPNLFITDDATLVREVIPLPDQRLLDSCFLTTRSFSNIQSSSVTLTVMCPEAEAYQAFEKYFSLLKFTFGLEFSPPEVGEVQMVETPCVRTTAKSASLLNMKVMS